MLSTQALLMDLSRLRHNPAALLWPVGFYLLGRMCRRHPRLLIAFVLPGTVLHELAHWLSGLLLGARPVHLTVIPKIEGNSIRLGQVQFARLRWWNALPVGLAPLLLLPLGLCLLLDSHAHDVWTLGSAAKGYMVVQCLSGFCPSSTDLAHAGRSALVYALLGLGLWALITLLRHGY